MICDSTELALKDCIPGITARGFCPTQLELSMDWMFGNMLLSVKEVSLMMAE
jgi:hypothetical protein